MSASAGGDASLEQMRAEVVDLRMSVEEMMVRGERDPLIAGVEGLAAGERVEQAVRGGASTVLTSGQGIQTGTSHLANFRPMNQSKQPKFNNVQEHFEMWTSKVQAHLSWLGVYMYRRQLPP